MAQTDSNIPLGIRTPNLADLADSFLMARKAKQDNLDALQARQLRQQQADLANKQNTRADRENFRQEAENKRQQTVHDEMLTDLANKRKDARHAKINSLLGEEAESIFSLPQEKRQEYYTKHVLPGLEQAGFDTKDMPDYSDELINGWRQKAMTPGERSDERTKLTNPYNKDMYDIKIDGKTGEYIYVPKTPGQLPNQTTGITAPPQVGVVQGAMGPMGYSFPKGGGGPTALPITNSQTGSVIEKPKATIPTTVQADIRNNFNQLRIVKQIQTAIASSQINPTGVGKGIVAKLPFGNQLLGAFDEKGEPTRELIGQLSSLKMKDISGAVINAAEMPRLARWIPQLGDEKKVVKMKLENYANEIATMNQEIGAQYTSGQGYKEDPLIKNQSQGQSSISKYKVGDKKVNTHGDKMVFDGTQWRPE